MSVESALDQHWKQRWKKQRSADPTQDLSFEDSPVSVESALEQRWQQRWNNQHFLDPREAGDNTTENISQHQRWKSVETLVANLAGPGGSTLRAPHHQNIGKRWISVGTALATALKKASLVL